MKCDVCGKELEKFEKYIEISIGMYEHAYYEDWEKKWKELPQKIKEFYGSFEKYLDDKTLSLVDIRYVHVCMDCIKQPEKVGKAILKKLKGSIYEVIKKLDREVFNF